MISKKNIFIIGTDTGVGKSVLSLLFMHHFFINGEKPFYVKPFQTGCTHPSDQESDACFIYNHIAHLKDQNPAASVLYCFKAPKAPWFSARDELQAVDLTYVLDSITHIQKNHWPVIIEAAGGIMVPVDEKHLIIDLVKASGATPVIAARAGLGTINHSLLTIDALKNKGITNPIIVFIDQEATNPKMVRENMEAIEYFSGIRVSGVIGPITDFSNPDPQVLHIIASIIEQMRF